MAGGEDRLPCGIRYRGSGAGGTGYEFGEQSGQNILRGMAQRHGSQPQRTEGSPELLFLQGYPGA